MKDILEGLEGKLISIFFRAYDKFEYVEQQNCLAHLPSDITELIVKLQRENERIGKRLNEHEETVNEESRPETIPKKRGRPRKREPLNETQVSTLRECRRKNIKSINQAIQLKSFFQLNELM